jgi:hypothetical protein
MKKIYLLSVLLIFTSIFLSAQIENPGFEDWEDAGTVIDEPVNWSSIKTSDNPTLSTAAPVVWELSTDSHTGNYSIKLFNVVPFPGLVAAGTLTNGRIHADFNPDLAYSYTNPNDDQWHTVCTTRPDSIAFWYKYYPEGNDTMQFQALLHVGDATIPPTPENQANRIGYTRADIPGQVTEWTRIALPFEYFSADNPEYILIILTAGAGTQPIEGSWVLFDDLELVSGSQAVEDNYLLDYQVYYSNNTLFLDNPMSHNLKSMYLEIFDIMGKKLFESPAASEISLGHLNLTKGFYIVNLNTPEASLTKKITIQ